MTLYWSRISTTDVREATIKAIKYVYSGNSVPYCWIPHVELTMDMNGKGSETIQFHGPLPPLQVGQQISLHYELSEYRAIGPSWLKKIMSLGSPTKYEALRAIESDGTRVEFRRD